MEKKQLFSILSTFLIVLYTDVSYCQTDFYSQYRGKTPKAEYEIFLQSVNGSLSGNLCIKPSLTGNDPSEWIEFSGHLETDSTFGLHRLMEENEFATGNLSKNQINGIFQFGQFSDTLLINSNFRSGETSFDIHRTQKTSKLVKSEDSPEASFESVILVPDSNSSKELIINVIKFLDLMPDSTSNIPDISKQLRLDQEAFMDDYHAASVFYDHEGASFNWFKTTQVELLTNSQRVFCLGKTIYAFTGGAHGMENLNYGNFELDSGKELDIQDIFLDKNDSLLTNLLTRKLKEKLQIPSDSAFPEGVYFVEEVEPCNNIYITSLGLGFYYNSYEIAPYSTGQTNLFFKFEEIKPYLTDSFKKLLQINP
jgi:hypothetical protein